MRECVFWKIKQWHTSRLEKQREELCLYSPGWEKMGLIDTSVSVLPWVNRLQLDQETNELRQEDMLKHIGESAVEESLFPSSNTKNYLTSELP